MEPEKITPTVALERLMLGNRRFADERLLHPDRKEDRRQETAAKQTPFAVIVGCADSRIPPEIVFDQGIGDLFVVRQAGNVISPIVLESILFSIIYNGSCLVVVLGHQNCGAVDAVLRRNTKDIPQIASLIEGALQGRDFTTLPMEQAVKVNVLSVVAELKQNPVISSYMAKGILNVVGGYYKFSDGEVEILNTSK